MSLSRPLWAVVAAFVIASPAFADHPGDDLDARMAEKEEHFEALDTSAPPFQLADPKGAPVRLSDFSHKVVVLQFIGPDGPDGSRAHAEKLAEIQTMINASAMKQLVQFVSISTDPTPNASELLRDFHAMGVNPINWMLLTRSSDQPESAGRDLASQYGVEDATDRQAGEKSVTTHIIDPDGRLAAQFNGIEFKNLNAVLYVNGVLNNSQKHREPPGWFDRFRELLF